MRGFRLLKASTFASPHAHAGSRGLSSIGFISRLFGASPTEPRPKKDPSYQTVHGVELQDDFHWLKYRGSKVSLTEKFPPKKIRKQSSAYPHPTPVTTHGLTSFLKVKKKPGWLCHIRPTFTTCSLNSLQQILSLLKKFVIFQGGVGGLVWKRENSSSLSNWIIMAWIIKHTKTDQQYNYTSLMHWKEKVNIALNATYCTKTIDFTI